MDSYRSPWYLHNVLRKERKQLHFHITRYFGKKCFIIYSILCLIQKKMNGWALEQTNLPCGQEKQQRAFTPKLNLDDNPRCIIVINIDTILLTNLHCANIYSSKNIVPHWTVTLTKKWINFMMKWTNTVIQYIILYLTRFKQHILSKIKL